MSEFVGLLGGFDFGTFLPWLGWIDRVNGLKARMNRVVKEMHEFLEVVLEEHLDGDQDNVSSKGESGEDFADVLLGIHKTNVAGISIDRDAAKALLLDIFAGGTDTTYTVLEWPMTELVRHPKILIDLQKEVRGIVSGRTQINEDDLEKTKYLKAVIKETLRLHPPIPLLIPRKAIHGTKILKYAVARGTMVITNAWAIHRDPALLDEPKNFKPERFL